MKKAEQYGYLLAALWEGEGKSLEAAKEYCGARGIAEPEAAGELLQEMEKKGWIRIEDGKIRVLITRKEFEEKGLAGLSKFSQSFANGGSKDKMIYNPPSTSFTGRP